jgi:hypothetical protein
MQTLAAVAEKTTRGLPALKPILVTGTPRSGTTWTGSMLAAGSQALSVLEPLAPHRPCGVGLCGATFKHWFAYISNENGDQYRSDLDRTIGLRFNTLGALAAIRSARDARRYASEYRSLQRVRRHRGVALVKDPNAVFSAEWLARTYDMNVLLLVRNPAAYASSMYRLGWAFDFNNWVDQPGLMEDLLWPWEAEIRDHARNPRDLIDQAILVWRVVNGVVATYRERHPDWVVRRHEDLSRDPLGQFRDLYERFGLDWTERAAAKVASSTGEGNPTEAPKDNPHAMSLDSRKNLENYKKRLSAEDLARVRAGTADVAPKFYEPGEW